MWKYDSPIGTFYIKLMEYGKYALIYQGIDYDQCETPEIMASNFFMQVTCSPWDSYAVGDTLVPKNLNEWTRC